MTTQTIPVAEAAAMTALLRAEQNNILVPTRRDEGIIPICETFDRSAFEAILAILRQGSHLYRYGSRS